MNGVELADKCIEHARDQLRARNRKDKRLEHLAWQHVMVTNIALLEYHRERMVVGSRPWIRATAVIEQFEERLRPSLAEVNVDYQATFSE